jgi:23S rRNA pseudouridine2605 synthase
MKKDQEQELIRLNKFISHNSKYSRREADELIKEGEVSIAGKVVTDLATKVTEDTEIKIKNKTIKVDKSKPPTVIIYNKLKGEIVSKKDPQGRTVIYDTIPKKYSHFIPIGRLDFASEGMLLLTDDPKIATALMTSNLERVYNLKIEGQITPTMMEAMQSGLKIEDTIEGAHKDSGIDSMEFAPFLWFDIKTNTSKFSKLKVAITEGKNRELRRFFAHFGSKVMDLKRVSFGGINLNNLPSGKVRYLTREEYQNLRYFVKGFELENNGR